MPASSASSSMEISSSVRVESSRVPRSSSCSRRLSGVIRTRPVVVVMWARLLNFRQQRY
jgi:hypothetical protein